MRVARLSGVSLFRLSWVSSPGARLDRRGRPLRPRASFRCRSALSCQVRRFRTPVDRDRVPHRRPYRRGSPHQDGSHLRRDARSRYLLRVLRLDRASARSRSRLGRLSSEASLLEHGPPAAVTVADRLAVPVPAVAARSGVVAVVHIDRTLEQLGFSHVGGRASYSFGCAFTQFRSRARCRAAAVAVRGQRERSVRAVRGRRTERL